MLDASTIKTLLLELNDELGKHGEVGEVGLVGGAVMCLVYNARAATRDVDAVFKPTAVIRKLARALASKHDLPDDWLNDAAKAYVQGEFKQESVLSLAHLRVWAPEPRYMLAMKCLAARWDTHDRSDVIFLIGKLGLTKAAEVFSIIEAYYPKRRILPKTQFLVEELFEAPEA